MNKIILLSGVFLMLAALLCGCSDDKLRWTQLYHTDAEDLSAKADFSKEDTIGMELPGTGNDLKDTEYVDEVTIQPDERMIFVYVCGAVMCPGVYELPEGSRMVQAIEAAGGLTEDADALLVNQARIVEDGEQIRVYTKDEASQMDVPIESSLEEDISGKVNINTATAERLMTLPGIGEAKAEAIIAYRQQSGGFKKIEDIMNISGIKEAVFSKIKDRITV